MSNETIIINDDLRTMQIPSSIVLLGVESDDDVNKIPFQMPKEYCGFDLSQFEARINYMNSNGDGDIYIVDDLAVDEDDPSLMNFTWLVGRNACAYKGNTKFIVCLKKFDSDQNVVQEFNTTVYSLPVLEGLETTEAVVQQNADIIEYILTKIEEAGIIDLSNYYTKTEVNALKLPNPNPLTINGTAYDGSEAVEMTIEGGSTSTVETASGTIIHVEDAVADEAVESLTLYNSSGDVINSANVCIANKNLFRLDQIATQTVSKGVTFNKNADGSIQAVGTSTGTYAAAQCSIDQHAFVVGETYTISSGKTSGVLYVQLIMNYTDGTTDYLVSSNQPYTFTLAKPVSSVTGSVQITASGVTVNEWIYPMIELSDEASPFVKNTYSSMTYDGSTMPVLPDSICNIWSNNSAVNDIVMEYQADPVMAKVNELEKEMYNLQHDDHLDANSENAVQNKIVTAALNSKASNADLAIERSRISNIASLPEGSTTGDAELMDIRIGADGTTYDSAGDAVRGQIENLNDIVSSLTLGIDEDDGLLYLYINGIKHGEGVELDDGKIRYTITYNLGANIVSSNTKPKVIALTPYATTISSSNIDYQIENVTVTMGDMDITDLVVNNHVINIPSVTNNVTITVTALYYPSIVTDTSKLEIVSGRTGTLKVKLHDEPTQNQTVTLYTASDNITLSASTLNFTSENWNTYQEVTITGASVDDTEYGYVNLINSDPLMTESTVMVVLKELSYEDLVDTTIPTTGQHVLTLDDFTSTANTTIDGVGYVRLYGYNGAYTNVVMPAEMDGIRTLTCGASSGASTSNSTFSGNTTIEYVTFEDGCRVGEAGAPSSNKCPNMFSNCTNLIGVSNVPISALQISVPSCTSLKFIDNLDKLTNLTSMNNMFNGCTSLEYVQDLSGITGCGLQSTFRGCTNLKKIFGVPQPSTAQTFAYAFMGTQVERITIPENASNLTYLFLNNTHVNHVTILADDLATSSLTQIFGTPSQNIDVYANAESTTLASLQSMFASSTKVSVHEIGGADLPSIVVWGDSTSSPNRSWIEWPARLQTKLGTSNYQVKNQAHSGEFTTSTSARQGGNTIYTDAFTIPAESTETLVTLTTEDGQTFSNSPVFSAGGAFNPCSISGVSGSISKSGASYYFTRLENGSAVSVSADSIVTSDQDDMFNNSNAIMLIQMGHNGGWNDTPSVLLNQMQLMVDHFIAKGGTKYIVTGMWSGTWIRTEGGWTITQQFNAMAAEAFGSHWLNLPQDIAENCQTDNPNWTPTDDDLIYISEGKTPMGLTSDGSHPNEYGANSMMMGFYRKGVALGYWE